MARPVILLAVCRGAMHSTRELLGEEFRLVEVHTLDQALTRLARGGIDAVLAGLRFDGSLMPVLLDAAKANPATRSVPFVCCSLLPTMLLPSSLRAARQACEVLGAEAFIDMVEIERREGFAAAGEQLRRVLRQACARRQPGPSSPSLHGGTRPP